VIDPASYRQLLVKRHMQVGWWMILGFLTLGIGLEWLHATKAPWYINEAFEPRRHLWTLAHAHGVLLGLVHVAFAATMDSYTATLAKPIKFASYSLSFAGGLMPAGFFLGGAVLEAGEPGPAIALLPIGAVLLICAVAMTARIASRRP